MAGVFSHLAAERSTRARRTIRGVVRAQVDELESRLLLDASSAGLLAGQDDIYTLPGEQIGDEIPLDSVVRVQTSISGSLINIDEFRADPRFAGIDGSGSAVVVIDTGIDLDHPFFGPDADGNGIADRIVYQYDFSGSNDADASDTVGHGSNVASIVGSSDATYRGMAPSVNIIALKVFPDGAGTTATDADIEEALQWVAAHITTYNIVAVNMSLGSGNYSTANTSKAYHDEIQSITGAGAFVVCSAGNAFHAYGSAQGVALPAADPNALAISAVYDADYGSRYWASGATDYTTAADRITSFSQRSGALTTCMAPGAMVTGAGANGGVVTMGGTSQASPHIAGIAALAQQLAIDRIGRRLTLAEFRSLLNSSGVTVNDGDDEDDNVANTGLSFKRVDALALANAIWNMGEALADDFEDARVFSKWQVATAGDAARVSADVGSHSAFPGSSLRLVVNTPTGQWVNSISLTRPSLAPTARIRYSFDMYNENARERQSEWWLEDAAGNKIVGMGAQSWGASDPVPLVKYIQNGSYTLNRSHRLSQTGVHHFSIEYDPDAAVATYAVYSPSWQLLYRYENVAVRPGEVATCGVMAGAGNTPSQTYYFDNVGFSSPDLVLAGTVQYQDVDGTLKSASYVKVEAWERQAVPYTDQKLAEGYTDGNGVFSFAYDMDGNLLHNADDAFGESGTRDIYYKYFAENGACWVSSALGGVYTGETSVTYDVPGSTYTPITITSSILTPNAEAFGIPSLVKAAHDWLYSRTSWARPQVEIVYPSFFGSMYDPTFDQVKLAQRTAADIEDGGVTFRDVTYHEYGHAVHRSLRGGDLPPGSALAPDPHHPHTISNEGSALAEGWADFFAAAIANPSETVLDGNLLWLGPDTDGSTHLGNVVEGAVTSIFWQIRRDVSDGWGKLWTIMQYDRPDSIWNASGTNDFYHAWNARGWRSAVVDDIFVQNGIPVHDDAYEHNDIPGTAAALTDLQASYPWLVLADAADWFMFTTNRPATVGATVSLAFDGSEGALNLDVYSDAGATLVGSAQGTLDGVSVSVSMIGAPAGTYYVRVTGMYNGFNPDYALLLNVLMNRPPTDVALAPITIAENQPSGTLVGILSTTDPDPGDTFTYSLVSGTGSTDNAIFSISGDQLLTAASFDYESKGSYSIRIRTTDQGGLWFEKVFTINVTDVDEIAPLVSSWSVNDGAAQRSMVKELGVVFSEAVTLADGAVTVKTKTGASVPNTTVNVTNPSGDQKTYVLMFSGTGVTGGSLADGVYDLIVSAAGVQDLAGNALASSLTQSFHRLFGDSDGDRDVDGSDSRAFRAALSSSAGSPAYRWWFDFDNDQDVDGTDSREFRRRLSTSI